jgi:hypothetical protein
VTYPGDEDMSSDEARKEAEVLRGAICKEDPAGDQAAAKAKGMTVSDLCDEYQMAAERGMGANEPVQRLHVLARSPRNSVL